jgi:peptide/nickel transport system permease protein
MRGDYYTEARLDPTISPATLAALRAEHGGDRPLLLRYAHWVASAARGDWGASVSYNIQVGSLLWSRMRNTLLLTLTATALAWLIAVPAGVWLATTRSVKSRAFGRAGISLLMAAPDLLVVLVLQFLAARSGFLPPGGMTSMGASTGAELSSALDLGRHLALPVTALVLSTLPVIVMHSAAAISDTLASPFIRGARANGIPTGRLLYRHALPAAAHPLIALAGLSAGALLSGSVLVENATGWPGIGRLMLEGTLQRDANVVVAVVMLSAAFLLAGNFLSDLLLYAADPRIHRE